MLRIVCRARDETWLKTDMIKTTGWAPKGARLVDHAPFGHWNTQMFIAALRHDRPDAPWVIPGRSMPGCSRPASKPDSRRPCRLEMW